MNLTQAFHHGLTSQEAAVLLAHHGLNKLPEAKPPLLALRFLQQFKSPLIYVLLAALAVDILTWVSEGASGTPVESLAISAILLLNATLGAYQEHKADEALAKAKSLGAPQVWVLRDQVLARVAGEAIVPGDVMRIEAGDRIAADAVLLDAQDVSLDESVATGESLPVEKRGGDEILGGTLIVRGATHARVLRTGQHSTIGKLAHALTNVEAGLTPLEIRIRHFAKQIAIVFLILAALLTVGGLYAEGLARLGHVFMFSVALAVAAIPEGLPTVLTVALAIGVQRMALRKALVRKMNAVETLGSVTVIATDKTGTLTENKMIVQEIDATDHDRALTAMILANDADHNSLVGDTVDLALINYARQKGHDTRSISKRHDRLMSRPFDSAYKFMSVTVSERGQDVTYLKGAPEALLARSRIKHADKIIWERKVEDYARKGFRVLALAWKKGKSDDNVHFLGLIAMWDPPRKEVPEAVKLAQAAGVRVVMITGDHPATAKFAAQAIGINSETVITGKQIHGANPDALSDTLKACSVFARVLPEHKLQLVDSLKHSGEVVAVTGDGVNDALAIKRADVGIAMGQRGSDVTREVADIVLLDDNFSTIVSAIEEGRNIYENIVKFVCFFLSTDLALVLLVTGGLALAFAFNIRDEVGNILLPLTAVQLLWINVIADGPAALALTLDRNPGIMAQPPRHPKTPLLTRDSLVFIGISGCLKAAIGLAIFGLLPSYGYSLAETQSSVFLYEALAQLVFAYPVRHLHITPQRNTWLHVAVIGGAVLQCAALLAPILRTSLGLTSLSTQLFAVVFACVFASWIIAEITSQFSNWVFAPKN